MVGRLGALRTVELEAGGLLLALALATFRRRYEAARLSG